MSGPLTHRPFAIFFETEQEFATRLMSMSDGEWKDMLFGAGDRDTTATPTADAIASLKTAVATTKGTDE